MVTRSPTHWMDSLPVPRNDKAFHRELVENLDLMFLLDEIAMLIHAANQGPLEYYEAKTLLSHLKSRISRLVRPSLHAILSNLGKRWPVDRWSPQIHVGVPRGSWSHHLFYVVYPPDVLTIKPWILRLCRIDNEVDVAFAGSSVDRLRLPENPLANVPKLTPHGRAVMNKAWGLQMTSIIESSRDSISHGKPKR